MAGSLRWLVASGVNERRFFALLERRRSRPRSRSREVGGGDFPRLDLDPRPKGLGFLP